MGKEHLTLNDLDKEMLEYLYRRAYSALYDFIDEIPEFIISGGIVLEGREKGKNYGSPTVFKCQRTWLTMVLGLTGRILRSNFNPGIRQLARNLEEKFTERQTVPVEKDPNSRKDEFGQWHRMTTRDEIDESNAFLEALIIELDSLLSRP